MNRDTFHLNDRSLRWDFAPAGRPMSLRNADCGVTVDGRVHRMAAARGRAVIERRTSRETRIEYTAPGGAFRWWQRFRLSPNGTSLTIDSGIRNDGAQALRLGEWKLVEIDPGRKGRLAIGRHPSTATVFRQEFWNTRVQRIGSDGGEHVSQFIGHIYNPVSGKTFSANFVSTDRIISEHQFQFRAKTGALTYAAACMLRDHELPPGASLRSETLVVRVYDDPYRPLEDWARALQRRYRPKLNPRTTVGWLGWSWVDPLSDREQTPEAITLENARAMRERLAGFTIDYIWFSQVNLKEMLPGNWLVFDRRNFPGGFEATLKKLRALGFKPGLWVAPFWMCTEADDVDQHREYLVRDKDGAPLARVGGWEFTRPAGDTERIFHFNYLDGSHPGARDFIRTVFRTYRRMGVRYYMLDFLGCGRERRVWDPARTWTRADREIMEVIRDAAGPDTHLLSAVGTTPCYTGCVDAARVNTDFGEGRPLHPRRCLHNATYIVQDKYFGNIRKFLQNAASTWFTHRRLWINDYNLMTVGKPVPRGIAEITATVFGLSGSPIMLGDDIRRIDDERLRLIKLCLPRTETMAFPLDLFSSVQPESYARMLALPVKTGWDRYMLIAVFNLDDHAWRATVPVGTRLSDLSDTSDRSDTSGKVFTVYDYWNAEYLGQHSQSFSCDVPPNSCRLFRIARKRSHPWLLSSELHIQQGNVEITRLQWDRKRRVLSGAVTRPRGEQGALLFSMPDNFRLINHEGHSLMKVGRDNTVVIRREFTFTREEMPFELRFAPLKYEQVY